MDFDVSRTGAFWGPLRFACAPLGGPEPQKELRCPKCWSRDCVPGLPLGMLDRWRQSRRRAPYECRACGKRFYRFEAAACRS